MILGLTIGQFTLLHVGITLVAIACGFAVLAGVLSSTRLPIWTALFWLMTVLTSVTGFLFPFNGFTPALGTGIVATIVFIPAMLGLYAFGLRGKWRWIYAAGAVVSLYLNVFVFIVQSFQKIPLLAALAPTQSEPPFALTQGAVLAIFVLLGLLAVWRFRPLVQ
jgi:hypothetical protein